MYYSSVDDGLASFLGVLAIAIVVLFGIIAIVVSSGNSAEPVRENVLYLDVAVTRTFTKSSGKTSIPYVEIETKQGEKLELKTDGATKGSLAEAGRWSPGARFDVMYNAASQQVLGVSPSTGRK